MEDSAPHVFAPPIENLTKLFWEKLECHVSLYSHGHVIYGWTLGKALVRAFLECIEVMKPERSL
jgi:hypothetical protein